MRKIKLRTAIQFASTVWVGGSDGGRRAVIADCAAGWLRLYYGESGESVVVDGDQEITLSEHGEPTEPVLDPKGHKVYLGFYVHRPLTVDDVVNNS